MRISVRAIRRRRSFSLWTFTRATGSAIAERISIRLKATISSIRVRPASPAHGATALAARRVHLAEMAEFAMALLHRNLGLQGRHVHGCVRSVPRGRSYHPKLRFASFETLERQRHQLAVAVSTASAPES